MAVSTDLTTGGVRKQLIKYALPVIATTVMQTVYSLVDLLVVSRLLGSSGASGVSNSAQVTLMLTNIAVGLSNGGNILVSQYFGAHDKEKCEQVIGTFIILFALVGVTMSIVCFAFSGAVLHAIQAPAFSEALDYLRVAAFGLIFVCLYNCLSSVLRALGNSKQPMKIIVIACVVNFVLDLFFVGPLHMGTAGAATATVLAQVVSFALALDYMLRNKALFSWKKTALKMEQGIVIRILKLGIPNAVQMLVASISWLSVAFLINGYGVAFSAASAYAAKVKDLSMMFIIALTNAAAVMVGQNLGAKLFDRGKKVMYEAMKLSMIISVVLVLIVEILAPLFAGIFTADPEVIKIATLNMRIEILGQLFYAIFLIYHALMIGAADTQMVLVSSFVNCILFRVPLAWIMNALFGVIGIFVACAIAPASSILVGWIYVRSNHWMKSVAN